MCVCVCVCVWGIFSDTFSGFHTGLPVCPFITLQIILDTVAGVK